MTSKEGKVLKMKKYVEESGQSLLKVVSEENIRGQMTANRKWKSIETTN